MFFSWKHPLKRKISNQDLLDAQDANDRGHSHDAFLGASLLDKHATFLNINDPVVFRISGDPATYAPDVAIKLIRSAIEKERSVLAVDFTGAEYWHRFWALSFYLDHVKDYRVLNFMNPEGSDSLGGHVPDHLADLPKHLGATAGAVDPAAHLKNHQGLLAVCAPGMSDAQRPDFINAMEKLCLAWAAFPDLLVVFGWDGLKTNAQQDILQSRLAGRSAPGLVLVQNQLHSLEAVGFEAEDIIFRHKAAMSEAALAAVKARAPQGDMAKALSDADTCLSNFDDGQCVVLLKSKSDLVQTPGGEGLPWPPEYKPFRSR